MKYDVEDFSNAKFAEHEDGSRALRCDMGFDQHFWIDQDALEYRDKDMASDSDWTPVFQPQITQSEFKDIAGRLFYRHEGINDFVMNLHYVLKEIGVPVVEDPKKELPTEPGSVVRTESGTIYVLGKNERWWYGARSIGPTSFDGVGWEIVE